MTAAQKKKRPGERCSAAEPVSILPHERKNDMRVHITNQLKAAISRRTMLAGMAVAAVPVTAAAKPDLSIDCFLATATDADKARYHANALAEAMGAMHPDHDYVATVRHDLHVAFVVGHRREARS
ncbi:hypothetical protein E2A64_05535 [Pseudohoeflea suaedae]|uniref:Uncharacterized protein n=1 Tax=Pseudohoeflea suaedae TaxID=877384 RepID=A0A4R5PNZ0_9HYPH|nr:hypothetical protein [Pseudohoeflea suaedae]TDH38563.1 hypothetical protein E2A64_05535 [Pseudohoeflea suaedae]